MKNKKKLEKVKLRLLSGLYKLLNANELQVIIFSIKIIFKAIPCSISFVGLLNKDESRISVYAWLKNNSSFTAIHNLKKLDIKEAGLITKCYNSQKPLLINKLSLINEDIDQYPIPYIRLQNFLGVPIFDKNKIVSIVCIGNKNSSYSNFDIYLLNYVFNKIWSVLKTARKIQKLKKSKEKYRAIVETSPNSITITDFEGNILDVNKSALNLFGFKKFKKSKSDVKNQIGYIVEEDKQRALSNIQKVLEKGYLNDIEYKHYKSDGTIVPIEVCHSLLLDQNKKPVAMMNIARDISERKSLERNLENITKEVISGYKKLNCLNSITEIIETSGISLDEIFQKTVEIIPTCYAFPEEVFVRIVVNEKEYKSISFKTTEFKLFSDININGIKKGYFEIYYLSKKNNIYAESNVFIAYNQRLIKGIVERLEKVIEKKEINSILLFLAKSSTIVENENIFKELVKYLAINLEIDYVSIEQFDSEYLSSTSEAIFYDGKFKENYTYFLHNSPAKELLNNSFYCFTSGVRYKYPNDWLLQDIQAESYYGITIKSYSGKPIGSLSMIGRKPMQYSWSVESLFKIIIARLSAELERKIALEELQKSEAKYRNIFNISLVGIICTDKYQNITDVNPSGLLLLGYNDKTELLGQSYKSIIFPKENIYEVNKLPVENIYLSAQEIYVRKKDGTLINCIISANIEKQNGDIIEVIFYIIDNTEKKKIELSLIYYWKTLEKLVDERTGELKKANAILERIFASTHFSIVYFDNCFNYIRVNKNYADIMCSTQDYFVGKNIFDLYDDEITESIFRQVIKTKKGYTVFKKQFIIPKHPELEMIYWDWTLEPVLNKYEEIEGFILVLINVTDKVKTEQALMQSSKMSMIGEMSARIAHELNQPLTSIKLCIELIKDEIIQENPDMNEVLESIEDLSILTQKISKITNEIRYFSKPSKTEINKLNINSVIKKALLLFKEQFTSGNISLELKLTEKIKKIKGDENQIEQVIVNILKNAMEAVENQTNKLIIIQTFSIKDKVIIRIIDNGIGISQEAIKHLFIPYFSTKERSKGTGLGLSISQKIISDHGGTISIENNDNNGVKVEITLPMAQ